MEEVEKMKKVVKNAIKFVVFISVASLPFITVTQLIGIDTFIDSFENSDYYLCFENDGFLASSVKQEEYIIIQRSSHPDFKINDGDSIIFWDNNGEIVCNKIIRISNVGSLKRYNTIDNTNEEQMPIYENQIIGKVINSVENNVWFSISLKIWDLSIQKLNFNSLLTNE
jgi:hypothetical protein